MELPALTLILCAAIFHATWNTVAKSATGDTQVFVWGYNVAAAVIFIPIALVQLNDIGWPGVALIVGPLLSGALHVAYQLILQTGYSKADLGIVYPTARGVGPLLTMVFALTVLKERPEPHALAGASIVLVGILIAATGATPRPHRLKRGLLYGGATGVVIATYTLWDNRAVTAWELEPIAFYALTLGVQAVLLTPVMFFRKHAWKEHLRPNWWRILILGALVPTAYILVLTAQQSAPISIVAPVRETSIVLGSLAAWLIYREERPVRRLLSAGVVLAGITLLAL